MRIDPLMCIGFAGPVSKLLKLRQIEWVVDLDLWVVIFHVVSRLGRDFCIKELVWPIDDRTYEKEKNKACVRMM